MSRSRRGRWSTTALAAAAAALLTSAVVVGGTGWQAAQAAPAGGAERHVCGTVAAGRARCLLMRGIRPQDTSSSGIAGYGPADIQSAYRLPTGVNGRTVAVVVAYDMPTAESDLAVYRSTFGLPACTTTNGCFRKIDQRGGTTYPPANTGWSAETDLDIQMVSATCPLCHIMLVEADSGSVTDLGTAVNRAVSAGAAVVSMSWAGPESFSETSWDAAYLDHPGVALVAASGDGSTSPSWPASSPAVTAVSGTTLTSVNGRGWSEQAWKDVAVGCSAYEEKPSFQHDYGCNRRTTADVAAVGDPNTPVAVYDSFGEGGWEAFGGTSVSAPIIAGVYAMASPPSPGDSPVSYPYNSRQLLFDVTQGSLASCTGSYLCEAGPGYDAPTGLGTPNGVGAFGPSSQTFAVAVPPTATVRAGSTTTLTVSTKTTSGPPQNLSLFVSGLPAGSSASFSPGTLTSGTSSTLTISTAPSTPTGTSTISVTAYGSSASHTATFSLTVQPPVVNGGFEAGTLAGWTASGAATSVTTTGTRAGTHAALLGSVSSATNGDSSIGQTFTVPAGEKMLTFWHRMTCPDSVTYDWETATLVDTTTSTTTTVVPKRCSTDSTYLRAVAPVTPGHTYRLTITSHDDGYAGDPSATEIDDVVLSPQLSDFTLAASPSSATISAGTYAGFQIATTASAADTQPLELRLAGLPASTSASFSPASIASGSSTTLKLATTTSTPAGKYTVTVTATSATATHRTTITLTVS